jgi:hypothetical protein
VTGSKVISHDGIQAVLAPVGTTTPEDIVRGLISCFPVVNIAVVEANLEDVMRDVYLTKLDEQRNDPRDLRTESDRRPA